MGNTTAWPVATFAAGCFWGTEKFFRKEFTDRIADVEVGYIGGAAQDPTYQQVCTGSTGHAEAVQFRYDPKRVDYADLARYFFRFHDPTQLNGQGNDTGTQYRSAIFVHSDEQRAVAQAVLAEVAQARHFGDRPITTEIVDAGHFFTAEEYHQRYLERNPSGYCNHFLRY